MRFSVLISVAIVAGSTAGCQTIGDIADSVTEPARAPKSDASAPAVATAPTGPGAAEPRADMVSGGLSGMSADRLRAAWGEPVLKRQETGSELWQYGGPGCAVLIYLYPGSGSTMIVSHAEAVPGGADEAAVAACAKAAGKPSLKPVS